MSTGYEIKFGDFRQLLSYPPYRVKIAPLIQSWFDYQVIPNGDDFVLRDSKGVEVSQQTVHETIQADRDKQFHIYQAAMSLWR
jgi:hypothetical protein